MTQELNILSRSKTASMLEKLRLKYLSPKGKQSYWIGQIVFIAFVFGYIFIARDLPFVNEAYFLVAILFSLAALIAWGGICLLFWHKNKPAKSKKEQSIVS